MRVQRGCGCQFKETGVGLLGSEDVDAFATDSPEDSWTVESSDRHYSLVQRPISRTYKPKHPMLKPPKPTI